jgi:hypothetical protein
MKTYRLENAMDETELPDLVKFFADCNKDLKDMETHDHASKMPNNRLCGNDKKNYRED